MGKEQELLEAARNGNFPVVERILAQRAKKTGPLASLRRGPGANTQDQSGYTSLHHSALNGHKDIVSVLLAHEASTNVVDNKGSTPLHLAAWTGNTEIVKILLDQGPSVPNVNLANHDHETPLHSAAQYGHTDVVSLLLQHNSDPSVRNQKGESPLDLAAQYGRLETVEMLVKSHPELLRNYVLQHSPLHLASRNGHKQVVKVLLDAGFDVNLVTDTGSALHEAALYGKVDVVKLLLDYGVDVNLENRQKRTVHDLLNDLNSAISKQTRRIIKGHTTLVMTDEELGSPPSISPPPGFLSDSGSSYVQVLGPDGQPCRTSSSPLAPHHFNFYEVPPPPRLSGKKSPGDLYQNPPLAKSHDSSFDRTSSSRSPSLYDVSGGRAESDTVSVSSFTYRGLSPGGASSGGGDTTRGMYRTSRSLESDSILYEVPPPPGKRFSDPLQQQPPEYDPRYCLASLCGAGYLPMASFPTKSHSQKQPPAKPPRRSIAPVSPVERQSRHFPPGYEYLCLATSSGGNDYYGTQHPNGGDYVDMRSQSSAAAYENHSLTAGHQSDEWSGDDSGVVINGTSSSPFSALYDEIASGRATYSSYLLAKNSSALTHGRSASDCTSGGVARARDAAAAAAAANNAKPNSLNLKRATVQIPLSPTHYKQPPTPDFPPPSPATAVAGIHSVIRPLSQESSDEGVEDDDNMVYHSSKRISRDIETLTDEELCATVDADGRVRLILRRENKSVSTDNIEEIIEDNPFAGLYRGSVHPAKFRHELKMALTSNTNHNIERKSNRRPRNMYENVKVEADAPSSKPGRVHLQQQQQQHQHQQQQQHQHQQQTADDKSVSSTAAAAVEKRNSNSLAVMSPFDENAEWAEIADIMASFGSGIARESVFAKEIEEHFANVLRKESGSGSEEGLRFSSMEDWLSSIGFSEYENLLVHNGYDDIEFVGGNVLDDQDLLEIGLTNADHRSRLVAAGRCLPGVKTVKRKQNKFVPGTVDEWLRWLRLEEYQDTFRRNGYLDMERVLKLWEVELNTVLEITKLGHQRRILASLGERTSDRCFTEIGDIDLTALNLNLSDLNVKEERGSYMYKDYGSLTPRSTPSVEDSLDSVSSSCSGGGETLKIRPPTQLMSEPGTTAVTSPQQLIGTMPSFLTAQWKHESETLVQGCCNYTAQYLGSTLVKELKGMESSRKSIQKLKSSTREIAKIPYVILSISFKGVKFIDAHSQLVVCEHEIRNIHCACQDADDLNHFAYITKEHQTNNHYCHVFCAQNMDLATEIILTLGQAFEVAYQLALRETRSEEASRHYVSQLNVQLVHKAGEEIGTGSQLAT